MPETSTGGVVWIFYLSPVISLFFHLLSEGQLDILKEQ